MALIEIIHTSDKLRENRLLMLRQESFGPVDFIKNTVASFKESAMKMKDYFLLLQGFRGEDKTLSSIRSKVEKAEKSLKDFNFVSNHKTLIPVPLGFKEDMPGYTDFLHRALKEIIPAVLEEISAFNTELSVFISDKSVKLSIRDNSQKAVMKMRAKRAALTNHLSTYYTGGSSTRKHLGDVFDNAEGILLAATQSVNAYELAYKTNPKSISGDVETICGKIDTIINMAQGEEDFEVSPESIRNLAEKAYEVGRQVELLAVFCTEAETAAVLMDETLERVMKL